MIRIAALVASLLLAGCVVVNLPVSDDGDVSAGGTEGTTSMTSMSTVSEGSMGTTSSTGMEPSSSGASDSAASTDTEGGSGTEGTAGTEGTQTESGSSSSGGPEIPPYGPCMEGFPSCEDGAGCLGFYESHQVCARYCRDDAECPPATSGSAIPYCDAIALQGLCALDCSGGLACPDGMECVLTWNGSELCSWAI